MSKTAMIITIGARDLQLKSSLPKDTLEKINAMPVKNNPDCLCLSSARDDGKVVLENFSEFKDHLIYPIIKPGIDKVILEIPDKTDNSQQHDQILNSSIDNEPEISNQIDTIILVSTDQDDPVKENFKRNDTLHVADCIKKLIDRDYSRQKEKVKHLRITKNVTNYDSMYDFFDDKFSGNFFRDLEPDETSLYILPQGGIDAVNHTLLLKAIEKYPKTFQLCKPEQSSVAYLQQFPAKFRKNIVKHKIVHALENYNYASIPDFEYSSTVSALSEYALSLICLDYENAKTVLQNLLDEDCENRETFLKLIENIDVLHKNYDLRLKEVYITAKIKLKQKLHSDFLIKIFTLGENFLKPKIEEYLDGGFEYNEGNKHKKWNALLLKHPDLLEHLKTCKIDNNPLKFNSPNRIAYQEIYNFFTKNQDDEVIGRLKKLFRIIMELSNLRNKTAHDIIGVTEHKINERLKSINSSLDEFIKQADEYFEINKENPYGRFDEINEIIKNFL